MLQRDEDGYAARPGCRLLLHPLDEPLACLPASKGGLSRAQPEVVPLALLSDHSPMILLEAKSMNRALKEKSLEDWDAWCLDLLISDHVHLPDALSRSGHMICKAQELSVRRPICLPRPHLRLVTVAHLVGEGIDEGAEHVSTREGIGPDLHHPLPAYSGGSSGFNVEHHDRGVVQQAAWSRSRCILLALNLAAPAACPVHQMRGRFRG